MAVHSAPTWLQTCTIAAGCGQMLQKQYTALAPSAMNSLARKRQHQQHAHLCGLG
jgi:hypothetical protein